jgi:hypothetical protein
MNTFNTTLSDSSSQKYLLKILEIPGKSVTQKYIDAIKDKLDNLKLKYSFDIVLDENLIDNLNNTNGVQSGGASTYPYNMFESMLDNLIRKEQADKNSIVTSHEKLDQYKTEQQGYIDKFFSYKPLDDVKEVTSEPSDMPIKETTIGEPFAEFSEEHRNTTIDIPHNFAGVLHIQVTIYKPSNGLVFGLRELNQIE